MHSLSDVTRVTRAAGLLHSYSLGLGAIESSALIPGIDKCAETDEGQYSWFLSGNRSHEVCHDSPGVCFVLFLNRHPDDMGLESPLNGDDPFDEAFFSPMNKKFIILPIIKNQRIEMISPPSRSEKYRLMSSIRNWSNWTSRWNLIGFRILWPGILPGLQALPTSRSVEFMVSPERHEEPWLRPRACKPYNCDESFKLLVFLYN